MQAREGARRIALIVCGNSIHHHRKKSSLKVLLYRLESNVDDAIRAGLRGTKLSGLYQMSRNVRGTSSSSNEKGERIILAVIIGEVVVLQLTRNTGGFGRAVLKRITVGLADR